MARELKAVGINDEDIADLLLGDDDHDEKFNWLRELPKNNSGAIIDQLERKLKEQAIEIDLRKEIDGFVDEALDNLQRTIPPMMMAMIQKLIPTVGAVKTIAQVFGWLSKNKMQLSRFFKALKDVFLAIKRCDNVEEMAKNFEAALKTGTETIISVLGYMFGLQKFKEVILRRLLSLKAKVLDAIARYLAKLNLAPAAATATFTSGDSKLRVILRASAAYRVSVYVSRSPEEPFWIALKEIIRLAKCPDKELVKRIEGEWKALSDGASEKLMAELQKCDPKKLKSSAEYRKKYLKTVLESFGTKATTLANDLRMLVKMAEMAKSCSLFSEKYFGGDFLTPGVKYDPPAPGSRAIKVQARVCSTVKRQSNPDDPIGWNSAWNQGLDVGHSRVARCHLLGVQLGGIDDANNIVPCCQSANLDMAAVENKIAAFIRKYGCVDIQIEADYGQRPRSGVPDSIKFTAKGFDCSNNKCEPFSITVTNPQSLTSCKVV